MPRASRLIGVWLGLGAVHCSGSEMPSNTVHESSGGRDNAGGGDNAGGSTDGPPALNGCEAADFDDRSAEDAARTVEFPVAGLNYGPRCMTVAIGQTVRWEGRLNAHPLYPGNADDALAGSPDSPIAITSTGSSVEFTFGRAGTFPYWCEVHSDGPGTGMAGVIHVKE